MGAKARRAAGQGHGPAAGGALTDGPQRAAHVDPDAPRAVQEFDGTQWVTLSIAVDLAAAEAVLYPPQPEVERLAEWDRPAMEKGREGIA
ncbi:MULTISPECIES: DUF6087 family protein [unclassified Streptomyces]|uniref:DUF6087 family protein n=1 Tax=unclassified Streptomyces TaxID=2593676 RepID=UPI0033D7C6B7